MSQQCHTIALDGIPFTNDFRCKIELTGNMYSHDKFRSEHHWEFDMNFVIIFVLFFKIHEFHRCQLNCSNFELNNCSICNLLILCIYFESWYVWHSPLYCLCGMTVKFFFHDAWQKHLIRNEMNCDYHRVLSYNTHLSAYLNVRV